MQAVLQLAGLPFYLAGLRFSKQETELYTAGMISRDV